MNVYVESNFVLELALEQEEAESCSEIVQLAVESRLQLLVPAFSLAEPHQAIAAKEKVRSRLGEELRSHLGELGRSRPHRAMPATFGLLSEALIERAQFERNGLRRAISMMMDAATVIPLGSAVLGSAAQLESEFALSGQDAIVLASVLSDLTGSRPAASCFLSRNSKDFDDPDIRERLESLNCRFFARFGLASAYLKAQLR